jgi:hypothetical protein
VPYGPDSLTSSFNADSCAIQLGVPTCAEWLPDPLAFLKFLTHELPDILGGWCLIAVLGAGMSASSGSLLALSAVVTHNICRQINHVVPDFINNRNLLVACRFATLPCIVIAASIGVFEAGRSAYLLVVAFDLSAASIVVPLFGCFYAKNPSPRAAIVAITAGVSTRVALEYALPKDGFLIFPFPGDAFLKVGPAASSLYPAFIDVDPSLHWNPEEQPCFQDRYNDWTGVDSLAAPFVALVCFCVVQAIENTLLKRALFSFPGGTGYDKDAKVVAADDQSEESDEPFEAEDPTMVRSDLHTE